MGRREQVQSIGRFEIRRLLGEGAQSAVFLAWDPHLEREVAIKTLRFSDAAPEQGDALLLEARAVSNLRHPNIVPIFEAGEQHGDAYLVFEYVEGPTLAQLVAQQGAMATARAVETVCGVLGAIDEAHRHGIVHRDLKPSNILISGAGEPRVMDFGIATRLADVPQEAGALAGTPAYMAPEYIQSREYTFRSDLFAVGLILYEMVSGERAVAGGSAIVTMQNIVSGKICLSLDSTATIDEKLRTSFRVRPRSTLRCATIPPPRCCTACKPIWLPRPGSLRRTRRAAARACSTSCCGECSTRAISRHCPNPSARSTA